MEDYFSQDTQQLQPIGPLPVGGRVPNGFGLIDGQGNVAEWCRDARGGAISKGGSWFDHPLRCRPSSREPLLEDLVDPRIGLRFVIPIVSSVDEGS